MLNRLLDTVYGATKIPIIFRNEDFMHNAELLIINKPIFYIYYHLSVKHLPQLPLCMKHAINKQQK